MFQNIIRVLGGDPNKREIEKCLKIVEQINALEPQFEVLSDDALHEKTAEFKRRLVEGETLDDLLPEAFAAVREAGKRTNGMRHYDVQLIGGIVLHQAKIAEMRTGEGKTLVATLPLYLNALSGKGVHLVTVNDYLARRDARWMAPIFNLLGMSVGVLQMASRTDNGRSAFIVDLEKPAPHEDQHLLRGIPRNEAYLADITYGTNSEFGFDYLRDNTTMSLADRVQRGHNYAIVDEVDNILIDEARTPLIISGPASEDTEWYARMALVVRQLNPEDYEVSEKDRTVTLSEIGEAHVEQILDTPLKDPERPEDITPEQARIMGYLEQSLRAQFLFHRNKDYLVQAGKVVIVDEFTGRLMPGRRWSDGLHQAVEAKEGVKVEPENVTYATITLQNYFRMYTKLAGMTGTALTEAEEFDKIYKLMVLPIPTNLEYQALGQSSPLVEISDKDEQGYKQTYYSERDNVEKTPVYWKRKDYPDVVYRTEEAKLRAITQELVYFYILGRPQLIGTTSVEHSERLSNRLRAEAVRRLLMAGIIRQVWLEKNDRVGDEREVPELAALNKPVDEMNIGEARQIARGLEMSFNPEDPENLTRLLKLLNLTADSQERLITVLQGGVPHQVLNARKHDEESQIIAHAGAFGAVTIATNMAGRGVDIKLGGELPEEALHDANRVLSKAGVENPYDMTMEERRQALLKLDPAEYGIYEIGVKTVLEYLDNMERVRALGGLHIIGSERHEARRIDNQLRGRAARQGDPGSSRFYLSLDDELMRLFGGGQVEDLMQRLKIDEAVPIESGIVGRLVEQSQTRVEGNNFDIRKHLLEYDDVLNDQRVRIYGQRDAIFTKNDLSEDVTEMLRTELNRRIPISLKDEEGPWRLLAYLEDVQPPILYEDEFYPSYTQKLLLDNLFSGNHKENLRASLLELAERAFDAEQKHMLESARTLVDKSEETLNAQISEREDALDAFVDGLEDQEEGVQRRPQEIVDELSAAVHFPVKLAPDLMRSITTEPKKVVDAVRDQMRTVLTNVMTTRLIGSFERRLEEPLDLKLSQIQGTDWDTIANEVLSAVENVFTKNHEKLLGSQGQIARDIDPLLEKMTGSEITQSQQIALLTTMSQGNRMIFDKKTHRQAWQRTTRLRYVYLAAHLLEDETPQNVAADVLEHFEGAQVVIGRVWGKSEWLRLNQTSAPLPEPILKDLEDALGEEVLADVRALPLENWPENLRQPVSDALGQRVMRELYRQLLLNVISEMWVDYLTRVEALRVSIGLEAYAQRDPLVQYKSEASDMFQILLSDVRAGVISRMFNYRPRLTASAPAAGPSGDKSSPIQVTPAVQETPAQVDAASKSRKRHRH
jgi:preprotein translocase subunit SecA